MGAALLGSVWFRAAVLHPFALVAPLVLVCRLLAGREGSELSDVSWGLWLIQLAAVASFLWTRRLLARRELTPRTRALVTLAGAAGSAAGSVLGLLGWLAAADVACHGRYECPV